MIGIGLLGIIGAIVAFTHMLVEWMIPLGAGLFAAVGMCGHYCWEFGYQIVDILV